MLLFFRWARGGGEGGGAGESGWGPAPCIFLSYPGFFLGPRDSPPPQSSPWSAPDPGWVNVGRPPPPNRVLSRRPGMSSLSITGKMVSTLGPRPGAIFFRVDEAHFEPLPPPLSVLGGARPPFLSLPLRGRSPPPLLCSIGPPTTSHEGAGTINPPGKAFSPTSPVIRNATETPPFASLFYFSSSP